MNTAHQKEVCDHCSSAFDLLKIAAFELGILVSTLVEKGSDIHNSDAAMRMSFAICEDAITWIESAMDELKESATKTYVPVKIGHAWYDSRIKERTIRPADGS